MMVPRTGTSARGTTAAAWVDQRSHGDPPRRRIVTLIVAAIAGGGCLGGGAEETRRAEHAVIGECTRDEVVLRGDPAACAIDLDCPCGSYCDTADHTCQFDCMVPPADPTESCATGTQCDDTGRCVAPGGPSSLAAVLSASPASVRTQAGGASKTVQVKLTAFSAAALAVAQATLVRVIGRDGAEVSCDASTFGDECALAGWSFVFDGTKYNARRPIYVRTAAGTPDGQGEIQLRVDATATEVVLPATAGPVEIATDGQYAGSAISDGVPGGFPVTAEVHGRALIVRDPARVLAPPGTMILDLAWDDPGEPVERLLYWLRAPGAPDTAGAIEAETRAGLSTFDPNTGALSVPFTVKLPGGIQQTWTLELARQGAATACSADTECTGGQVCPSYLHACVPAEALLGSNVPVENKLEDTRSLAWWNAIAPMLGTGDVVSGTSKPAFATTGADVIEALLCTTSDTEAGAGRLGVTQVKQGTGPSRSGDLACVSGAGTANGAPGAVGLITRADRKGDAESSALLQTCVADLARPVSADFFTNFNVNAGDCVNLARFVPAMRLMATGELGKRAQAETDGRSRGLFTRLVQQWSYLQGFLASTGLSDREYDDAVAASPAEARAELLALLDVLDANWAALLDSRIARVLPAAATWGPTGPGDAERDYRLLKRPVAYWPLNPFSPASDLINGVGLINMKSFMCNLVFCPPPPVNCQIQAGWYSFRQVWSCPGLTAQLPAAPAVGNGKDLTVILNVDPLDTEFPPYAGGVMAVTGDMFAVYTFEHGAPEIKVIHPTGPGLTETIYFGGFGVLGHWTSDDVTAVGTMVAISRDVSAKTYTLYLWQTESPPYPYEPLQVLTSPYTSDVVGTLTSTNPRTITVGNGVFSTKSAFWTPYKSSFAGRIDDVAVFNSFMSKREFLRIAQARGYQEQFRTVYPADMLLVDHPTQEINVPVGAALLEAQAAYLDVVARLVEHMRYEAQTACEGDDVAAAQARADLDLIAARVGRSVRQSGVIEGFTAADTSERADDARQLLRSKRSQIGARIRTLTSCANPYAMGDDEVPLYFGSISPNANESAAFFAASDHLLQLAEQRAATAQSALTEVRGRWDSARQSFIQQLQSDNARALRVDEVESRFGDGLRRLCGIADRTGEQIMQDLLAGNFDVDTCFVTPTQECLAQSQSGPIMDADPACYRGALGAAIIDTRTAYHAQQSAYQTWQAAAANAEAAQRLCVWKEMDAFGCSALDEEELEQVECPEGHQGTIELIYEFNDYLDEKEAEKGWFDAIVHVTTNVVAVAAAAATTGPGAAFMTAALGNMSLLSDEMGRSMASRKRHHEEVLAKRAAQAAIVDCWNDAERFERAIAAAEETALQAGDQLNAAMLAFQNNLSEARSLAMEGPIVIDRELNRPSIPIAFHYWLPEAITSYRFALESARRYTYIALRAVEYDALDSYRTPQAGKPLRSAVLGAWRPNTLLQQLALMRDQTNTRTTKYGPPSLGHITFDLGDKVFGIGESSVDFGSTLLSYVRPVYSNRGEYLGLGVAFSLVPQTDQEAPTWRCAERIWRANVGTAGYPTGGGGNFHLKLLKRNTFASRRCRDEGFQASSLRPGANLLVAAGEPQTYVPVASNSVADISVVRLDTGNALDDFRHRDDAYNASSTELSLQGLYGDYVLLFPAISLSSGLDLGALFDFNLRFDYLSVDDTPSTLRATRPAVPGAEEARAPRLEVDASRDPIVME